MFAAAELMCISETNLTEFRGTGKSLLQSRVDVQV